MWSKTSCDRNGRSREGGVLHAKKVEEAIDRERGGRYVAHVRPTYVLLLLPLYMRYLLLLLLLLPGSLSPWGGAAALNSRFIALVSTEGRIRQTRLFYVSIRPASFAWNRRIPIQSDRPTNSPPTFSITLAPSLRNFQPPLPSTSQTTPFSPCDST